MSFKIFAWDFHGTLERGVEVGFWHILKQIAKERRIRENFKLSEVRGLYGISVAEYLRHFFPQSSDLALRQMRARIAEVQNQKHLKKFVKPAPRAIEVLTKIKQAGHVNIVISNSSPKHIGPLVDVLGMKKLIEEIYAIDRHYSDAAEDPTEAKTRVLKDVIRRNNIGDGGLIVIGDRAVDINAGLSVGAITYQYLRADLQLEKTSAKYKLHDLREVLRESYAD